MQQFAAIGDDTKVCNRSGPWISYVSSWVTLDHAFESPSPILSTAFWVTLATFFERIIVKYMVSVVDIYSKSISRDSTYLSSWKIKFRRCISGFYRLIIVNKCACAYLSKSAILWSHPRLIEGDWVTLAPRCCTVCFWSINVKFERCIDCNVLILL